MKSINEWHCSRNDWQMCRNDWVINQHFRPGKNTPICGSWRYARIWSYFSLIAIYQAPMYFFPLVIVIFLQQGLQRIIGCLKHRMCSMAWIMIAWSEVGNFNFFAVSNGVIRVGCITPFFHPQFKLQLCSWANRTDSV